MSDPQPDFDQPASSGKAAGIGGTIFLFLFSLPFAGLGLGAFVSGIRRIAAGDYKNGFPLGLIGFFFAAIGFALMFGAFWVRKKANQNAVLKTRFADRPWMARPDWANGKIKSSATYQPILLFILGLVFCGVGGLSSAAALSQELPRRNYFVLLVLLFPLIGLGLVIAAVNSWRSQRRFGQCFFEPAQIPIPIGGVLEGILLTGAPLKLEHELYLKISCIHRTVTGAGKNQNVHEDILWQEEKAYRPDAGLLEPEPGHSGIPVHFKLPAGQPEAHSRSDDSIIWRLEAKSKMRGPGFQAAFDLPVFNVAGAAIAEPDDSVANEPDPTAALQAPMEEIRREENSRIQVNDGPNGREFYFPPARNIGACFLVTMIAVVFDAVSIFLWRAHAPILFPIIFSLFGLLLTFFAFSAWFKSSRVFVDSRGVQATDHWLFFRRARHFDAGDIESFRTIPGSRSGTQTFWNIKLFSPDQPNAATLASDINSKIEADWLVQEMTRALGRSEEPVGGLTR